MAEHVEFKKDTKSKQDKLDSLENRAEPVQCGGFLPGASWCRLNQSKSKNKRLLSYIQNKRSEQRVFAQGFLRFAFRTSVNPSKPGVGVRWEFFWVYWEQLYHD